MILAISGTPGTGKTAVAEILAKKLKWKLVRLNDLAKDNDLYGGWDPLRHVPIIDVEKVRKTVGRMGGNLILEAHYAHEIPADLVIILRTEPEELRKRLKEKGWRHEKVEENVEAEMVEVCTFEARELGVKFREIDTTGRKAGDVAEEIARMVKPGAV